MLNLRGGIRFSELYERGGLLKIDALFSSYLEQCDGGLHSRFLHARDSSESLGRRDESALITDLSPHVDEFIGWLFDCSEAIKAGEADHTGLSKFHKVKREFIQRRALKKISPDAATGEDGEALAASLVGLFSEPLTEQSFVRHVAAWLAVESDHQSDLDLAARYAAWATLTKAGARKHKGGILFRVPHKLNPDRLIEIETTTEGGISKFQLPPDEWRQRNGFGLTDPGMDLVGVLDQANYCIWCHKQEKDSCSRGLQERPATPVAPATPPVFKKSAAGVALAGCPLQVKISEMNIVKASGKLVGALAVIVIDNPMLAATGHRICNDCMKSCIYQKQEPVDIPQIETKILKDVLALPFGFEIYSLLTRWNPLNFRRPLPEAPTGRKVLVVGLGPAGFTLAHHLINDGHTVVAIDGLKIEPLEQTLCGRDGEGMHVPFEPVRDVQALYESLDGRVMAGFGGVAEYGITIRWNKNYLKLVRLLLERRGAFDRFGGVRFGGTLSIDSAFALGFDHIALCTGAGRPTVLPIKNGLAKGVRQASDFLMALQLTGAAKRDSIANLTVELPVVVVGGGLTAIDTATEALAYYPIQVERFLSRYERLAAKRGEAAVRRSWTQNEAAVADQFIAHGRAIRAEREDAGRSNRQPQILKLLREWGGVTVAYRRRLIDAPSYTLNHEEVAKGLEEGIFFAENLTPREVEIDASGNAASISFTRKGAPDPSGQVGTPSIVRLPARTILVAAGTQPNTVLSREDPSNVALDGKYFQACDESGAPVHPERSVKPSQVQILMNVLPDGRAISFFGDLHPSFAGNVVKAMGSAKQGYPVISRMLSRLPTASRNLALVEQLRSDLRATVQDVRRLAPKIVEIVLHAPAGARAFKPGQFFRLQNLETSAPRIDETTLSMEGLALTGAWVDRPRGLISTIVLEMGGSSDLCALLKPGEPVVLMGPTGMPTEIPSNETVALVGGGLGNAVLFSIGQALRENNSRVLYFAGYKKIHDRYHIGEIEKAADAIVWCCDEAPGFAPRRPQDRMFVGNIIAAMKAYGAGDLGPQPVALADADRVIAIGSAGMMSAVAAARHTELSPYLKTGHVAIGSINSPMQCMMKEICAQCLQMQRDPITGEEKIVFSCFNQDQPLDFVDFASLQDRLQQNSVQEKLTSAWVEDCLRELGRRPAERGAPEKQVHEQADG